ncbi:MAG: nuclear transport factor 2 family protein [Myxococcales bacterium]|nr:nuclear transport factor 2 family protein [Myxococcales bacterium]MCB9580909.1 nuclear transport factor 2 family protein [Polyangiaceae bacterium]
MELSISRRTLAVVGIVLGLGITGYALFGGRSDEEKIRALLDHLAEVAGVSGTENPVMRAGRLRGAFADIFTKDVRVQIPELSSLKSGREGLVALATQAGTAFRSAEISLGSVEITLIASGQAARVRCTATLVGDRGQGLRKDERSVRFGLSKDDGDWRIDSVSVSAAEED